MDFNKPTTVEIVFDKRGNKEYIVDNAYLQWFNFSGTETASNRKGKRNFVWRIPNDELAQQIAADGYNVKHYSIRDGYDGDEYDYLQIQLSYRDRYGVPFAEKYPGLVPHVYLVDDDNYYTEIKEDGVGEFDNKTILYAAMKFRRYDWDYNHKKGTTACVAELYLKVKKDPIIGRFRPLSEKEPGQVPGGADLPFDMS